MAQGAVERKASEVVAENARWIEWAGRLGFATKGVVYGVVGALAVAAAWGGGRAQGSEGAIREIGRQPFGQALLWLVGVGLVGYALWQFVEAAIDPERRGREWKDVLRRLGYALSGFVHLGLAVFAAPVTVPFGSGGGDTQQGLAAQVLSFPGGQVLLAAVGALVMGFACQQIYLAVSQNFMRDYKLHEMNETERKTARYTGTVGLAARGLTFLIIGAFVIVAAVTYDSHQTKNFGEALEVLARQPYGPWLLAFTGVGLIGYAIYCGTLSFYRRFAVR